MYRKPKNINVYLSAYLLDVQMAVSSNGSDWIEIGKFHGKGWCQWFYETYANTHTATVTAISYYIDGLNGAFTNTNNIQLTNLLDVCSCAKS